MWKQFDWFGPNFSQATQDEGPQPVINNVHRTIRCLASTGPLLPSGRPARLLNMLLWSFRSRCRNKLGRRDSLICLLSYNFEFPPKNYYSPDAAPGEVTVCWVGWTGRKEKPPPVVVVRNLVTQQGHKVSRRLKKRGGHMLCARTRAHEVLPGFKLIHFAVLQHFR